MPQEEVIEQVLVKKLVSEVQVEFKNVSINKMCLTTCVKA